MIKQAIRRGIDLCSNTPASSFSMVIGTASLAGAWRHATDLGYWHLWVSYLFSSVAMGLWASLLVTQVVKWLFARKQALVDLDNWIVASLTPLVFVASQLIANLVLDWSVSLATGIFVVTVFGHLSYTILYFLPRCFMRGHPANAVTPALYIPFMATNLTSALVAANLGWTILGQMLWGIAVVAWFILESIILKPWLFEPRLSLEQRPLFGVETAPPVVVCLAWLALFPDDQSVIVWVCLGWGLFLTAVSLRLISWWREVGFIQSFWSFSFGASALASCAIQLAHSSGTDVGMYLATMILIGSTAFILWLSCMTIKKYFCARFNSTSRTLDDKCLSLVD